MEVINKTNLPISLEDLTNNRHWRVEYGTDFKLPIIVSPLSDWKIIIRWLNSKKPYRGFCRATIPKDLLWVDDDWTILVDSQPITDYTKFEDANYTYLYFTYSHSTKTVTIKGTHAIPEFPSTPILILLILTTLITTTLWKTKRKHQPP